MIAKALVASIALAASVSAQTFTDCNPLEKGNDHTHDHCLWILETNMMNQIALLLLPWARNQSTVT